MSQSLSVTPGLIQFNEIPYTWRVPGNYMEVKNAVNENAVLPFPARGLCIGQFYGAGTGVAGTAVSGQIYNIISGQQADNLFGRGSMLAKMCRRFIKANPYTPFDAVGIADAVGAVAATGTLTFSGAATAPGTIALYFGGVRVTVGVNTGDTAAVIAANVRAAILLQGNAGYEAIPGLKSTYTAGTAIVNLTALNAGTLGNTIDVRLNYQVGDVLPPGVTCVIAPMAGGATDPTTQIATVLASLGSTWYTDVPFPYMDATNIGVFCNWLIGQYGAMVKLDAQGYVCVGGTYGTALNFTPNCKYLSVIAMQSPLSPTWEIAAAMAGACCYQTAQKPSLQLRTVPLPGIVAPATGDIFTLAEREVLLQSGFSTFYADGSNNVYLERVTTSYRTDPGTNVADFAWFDLNSTKVPTRVRYDWDAYIGQVYPRNNLCNDGTIAAAYDPDAVTPNMLKASWTSRSGVYEKDGWIQNSAQTAKSSTFVIDANDGNRVDARQQIQIMGNLIVLAGSLEFISNN